MNVVRRNVLLLAACQAMMMTGGSLLVATSALVGFRLSPDKSVATLPLALQMLATMLTTIPASLLMQRLGRRAGFLIGSAIGVSGAALAAWAIVAGSFPLFAAGAVLSGVFSGFGSYYRFAAADAASSELRSRAISWVLTGGVVAALVGPNLARWTRGWLATPFAGSYVALTGVMLLSFVTVLFLDIPRPPAGERGGGGRPLGVIGAQPVFVVAAIGGMVGYGVMSLVMSATPLAMQAHEYPFADTAFVIQWHALGMFAPSFFTGNLIRRFGVLRVMLAGVVCSAACVLVNLSGTSLVHYWMALLLLGLGWNFQYIGATTLLTEAYAPAERAKTQALNDFLVFTTVTVAVLLAGRLQHSFGWRAVNLGVLPALTIALVAIAWLAHVRRTAPSPSPASTQPEAPSL
jgi:MFS family permease